MSISIWVDADACPIPCKDVLYKFSETFLIKVIFVANRFHKLPRFYLLEMRTVSQGPDVADEYIVDYVQEGDIVITADIPLSDHVIKKSATVLNPLGEVLDKSNIAERLSMRNFMDEMRSSGQHVGQSKSYSERDKKNFAGALDRLLALARNRKS